MYDRLQQEFGRESVFIDVDALTPGDDFAEAIEDRLMGCDLLLAVIGPRWLTAADEHGRSRLQSESDYVRLELETAFARRIRTVPVLVERATMPREQDLPESLRPLVRRHAIELSDSRWAYDVATLVDAIKRFPVIPRRRQEDPASAPAMAALHSAVDTVGPAYREVKPQAPAQPNIETPLRNVVIPTASQTKQRLAAMLGTLMSRQWRRWLGMGSVAVAVAVGLIYWTAPFTYLEPSSLKTSVPELSADPSASASQIDKPLDSRRADSAAATRELASPPPVNPQPSGSVPDARRQSGERRPETSSRKSPVTPAPRPPINAGAPTESRATEKPAAAPLTVADHIKRCSSTNPDSCTQACDGGDTESCKTLAGLYENGDIGSSKDAVRAVALYQRVCDRGDAETCFRLAEMYRYGENELDPDPIRAVKLFAQACESGSGNACFYAGQAFHYGYHGPPRDVARAVAIYGRGCELHEEISCRILGEFHETGEGGLAKDAAQAVAYYKRACDGNDSSGCRLLGLAYRDGRGGLPKDINQATILLRKSCNLRSSLACIDLAQLPK